MSALREDPPAADRVAERSATHLVLIPSYNPGVSVYETVAGAHQPTQLVQRSKRVGVLDLGAAEVDDHPPYVWRDLVSKRRGEVVRVGCRDRTGDRDQHRVGTD